MHQTAWFIVKSAIVGLALAFVAVAIRPSLLVGPAAPLISLADAVERSAPSVVSIYSATSIASRSGRSVRQAASLGSGVIMTADGYVVTNDHVVAGANELFVSLQSGGVAAAQLIGTDPDTDLALLRIDLTRLGNPSLPAMPLGDSNRVRTGDIVIAIGNPFGIGQTVTQGIVSATGRSQLGLNSFEDFVQTDAAINPGNSGGALVNAAGELVGINTAEVTGRGSEGISFAIPVNLVRGVVEQLMENGRVVRGWLGIRAHTLNPAEARARGVSGIRLTEVHPNTPAAEAGLRIGDVITAINDEPIVQLKDALHRVARLAPGTQIALSGVSGRGQPFDVVTTVVERPRQPPILRRGG